jgi:hypothetical protein
MSYCYYCTKEIEHVDDEPDYDYDCLTDEIIETGKIIKIYNHVHSGQHLCDSGGTGAIAVEELIPIYDVEGRKKWEEKRRVIEEQEKKDKEYDELCEREADKQIMGDFDEL